ncbi:MULTISPECIES: Xaa-Pro peptidase family protein [Halobacterium]|uniref:M24 family metallopeptidase n=1 Tax=Halobacterium TaxID=2239 RepID=UPI00073ECF1F|nr:MULTISPECIES: Xaa-Pro peptidase family protein [Halobacterium]MCG1002700.1 Xaa-Pro peptidase family protein [Halobacterium noricense]
MSAFEARTRRCQQRLRERDASGAVLFPSPNCYYLAGFREEPGERHLFLFVPADGDPAFVAPELYDEQLREATWVADVRTWADGEDPTELVAETASDLGMTDGELLVDPTMWARFTQDLRAALPDATWGLADDVLAPLRVRKDDAELDALGRAADAADAAIQDVRNLGADAVGMTERDLAAFVEDRLAAHGGDGTSFETIVGSGPNGAKPHHHRSEREIRRGDPVVLDFGTRVDGYPSDQTRTVVFAGDPPEEFERVHDVVREAQQAAVDAVEPGVPAEDVDAAAREVIENAGYGDQFVHRTGHGVGLDVHEEPYIVDGNDRPLEAGMVFSVEPGVYLDGEFGVRIEDLVAVTDDGCRRLNDTPRGWRP